MTMNHIHSRIGSFLDCTYHMWPY